MLGNQNKKAGRTNPPGAQKRERKLHSVHALLKQREFVGAFELGGSSYQFAYSPATGEISDRKFQLRGKLTVTDPRGVARSRDGVRALLASTQGAVGGGPPPRPSKLVELEEPGEAAKAQTAKLAATETTGPASYCGVMYFHLEPLDARALGVPADLSRVQLNARLAPIDDTARALHGVYSAIVQSLYGETTSARLSQALVSELNRLLSTI